MTIRTETYGDTLFVYSVEQEREEEDAPAIGIAALMEVRLAGGGMYIEGKFEIKPHCPSDEISAVKALLLKHITHVNNE